MPRSQIDDYTKFVGIYGAKGLAYIKVNERAKGVEGLQSPIVKFIPEANLNVILDRVGAVDGDIVFFGADKAKIVCDALGALRIKVGHDLKLLTREWAPMWVVDFPMFEENDDGSLSALHHPFTSPKCTPAELEAIRARRFPAPTTWCSTAPSWVAVPSVSTTSPCSRRCSACWASTRRSRKRSSASCSTRSSTVRRRMAAWPSA